MPENLVKNGKSRVLFVKCRVIAKANFSGFVFVSGDLDSITYVHYYVLVKNGFHCLHNIYCCGLEK